MKPVACPSRGMLSTFSGYIYEIEKYDMHICDATLHHQHDVLPYPSTTVSEARFKRQTEEGIGRRGTHRVQLQVS